MTTISGSLLEKGFTMEKQKPANQKKHETSAFNRADTKILIVEDDRTHRALMDKILHECEFQTMQAENGNVALSKLESGQQFNLIIMDWDMPELDGLETARKIRESEVKKGWPRTPVIAFTANRNPGDREKCLAAGMDAYLAKDVWMPKWRATLIDNLQGLIAGNFNLGDFEDIPPVQSHKEEKFDLDAIDIQALEQTAALLKDELAVAVEEYLEDAAGYIRNIQEGLESGNPEKAARGSHPLKSNSKGFGLTAVSQISEAINNNAREGDIENLESLLVQLQDAFVRAEQKLQEIVKDTRH